MNINDVQRQIFSVICEWVKTNRTPIAQKEIVLAVAQEGVVPQSTIKAAVRVLVKKGYIRKAVSFQSGASYVQLRSF